MVTRHVEVYHVMLMRARKLGDVEIDAGSAELDPVATSE
jgi:hypothetical protein